MKREYKKPYLFIETFRLSASVAASMSSCGGIGSGILGSTTSGDYNTCSWTTPWGQTYFATDAACSGGIITTPEEGDFGCYNTGSESNRIFGSN